MSDIKKVSEEPHEIRTAAESMNVPKWVIMLAKERTGSEDRQVLYDWIAAHRGHMFVY